MQIIKEEFLEEVGLELDHEKCVGLGKEGEGE